MQRPKTRYAKCDDLHIAYQVIGDGPIDLLYAQGWLSNVEYAWESPDYARFLNKLSRFARVIFFDKRGTGMSDRDVGTPTLEQRSQDINAVLDAVGSERAAVFGISEGGAIASVFAASFPERVSHLVVFGSRPRYRWAPDYPFGVRDADVEQNIAALLENFGEPFPLDTGAPSMAGNEAAAEWFAAYVRFSASPRVAEKITRMNYEIDYRDVLPAIHVPTLVLHREGDQWCNIKHSQYLAQHVEGAELRVLPGGDHIPWYGDQDRLVGEIEEFVTGAPVATASVHRALLTVVFVDIVASTEALAEAGDARWRSLLEQWDVGVTRRVKAYGGRTIKHTGDGYLLSFPGPTSAIECARDMQRDARRLNLSCKTGVHTGECEWRGEDLSGLAVHVAARIMSEADEGAIACSRTVRDLAVGSDIGFAPLGEKALKGVPGEWLLFVVSN